jgi:hypothetical protein
MLEVPSKYGAGDQKFCTPARAAMGCALSVCGVWALEKPRARRDARLCMCYQQCCSHYIGSSVAYKARWD